MKVGLFVPLGNGNANAEILRTLGREAEDRGFESIWVAEHVVMFDDYESQYPYAADGRFPGGGDTGLLEPLTALTYLAAVTDRIRLGTGICLVPQRNPVYTAKQVVDLDNLSGGRVDFGIGVGWLKEEFDVVAAPFAQRGARTDEYLQVMRSALDRRPVVVQGRALRRSASAACTRSPCSSRTRRSTSAARPTPRCAASPGTARAGTPSTASPRTSTSRWPASTSCSPPRAESGDDIELTVCPYLQPLGDGAVERYRERGVDRLVMLCLAFDVDLLDEPARHAGHQGPRTRRRLTHPWGLAPVLPSTDGIVTLRARQDGDAAVLIASRDAEFHRFMGDGRLRPQPTAVDRSRGRAGRLGRSTTTTIGRGSSRTSATSATTCSRPRGLRDRTAGRASSCSQPAADHGTYPAYIFLIDADYRPSACRGGAPSPRPQGWWPIESEYEPTATPGRSVLRRGRPAGATPA